MPGKFITVEGIEGVGKTTIVQYVAELIRSESIALKLSREPGGTPIAEAIREVLISDSFDDDMASDTELLLMFAARAQNIAEVIKPALAANQWILCDRFTDASFAYQGGGRGIPSERIAVLETWVQADLQPDVTLLLDAPLEIALERARQRSAADRIEAEDEAFFARVRQSYLDRAAAYPERFHIIDAGQSLEHVKAAVKQVIQEIL